MPKRGEYTAPPTNGTRRLLAHVPEHLKIALDADCEANGVTQTWIITKLLEEKYDR